MQTVINGGAITIVFIMGCMICSGFFSGSETAVTALNRYRLQYLADIKKDNTAKRLLVMLRYPQKLLGMILIANTFLNMMVSSLATTATIFWFGQEYVLLATVMLTFLVLVFAEVLPKSVAAYRPDVIAYKVAGVLRVLLFLMGPLVAIVNGITAGVLWIFGMRLQAGTRLNLSRDELGGLIKLNRQKNSSSNEVEQMLEGILDLDAMKVSHVMQPRSEMNGIDLNDSWHEIIGFLKKSPKENIFIYNEKIDNIQGYITTSTVLQCVLENKFSKETLIKQMQSVAYIPETTPLEKQLSVFKQQHAQMAVVVDEYGEICGIVEHKDIIDEIVGCYTHAYPLLNAGVGHAGLQGYCFYGNVAVRDVNKAMDWELPEERANTLGGLIIDLLECIPEGNCCVEIDGYQIEILQMKSNKVHRCKIQQPLT